MVASASSGMHGDAANIRGVVARQGTRPRDGDRRARRGIRERGGCDEDPCGRRRAGRCRASALRVTRLSRGAAFLRDGDRARRARAGGAGPADGLVLDEPRRGRVRGVLRRARTRRSHDHWEHASDAVRRVARLSGTSTATSSTQLWFLVRDGDEVAAVARNDAERRRRRLRRRARRAAAPGAAAGSARRCCCTTFARVLAPRHDARHARRRRREPDRRDAALRARRHARRARADVVYEKALA